MRRLFLLTGMALCLLGAQPSYAGVSTALVTVNGMVCDFCARAVEKVFGRQDGVQDVNVDLETKLITISFADGQAFDDETIANMIKDSGYDVKAIEWADEAAGE
jgi:copper chaperone CopZ